MAIDATAVARGTGITTNFKDLSNGAVRFVPQRIAIIAPGESGLSYSTDKYTIDGGAQQVGSTNGYGSPLYQIARELFPVNGDGIGTVIVDVIPLANPSGGASAAGAIDLPAGTATETASYYPVLGGVRGQPVLIQKGAIVVNEVLSDITDSINNTLGMPAKASNDYGAPVGVDSVNIALTAIAISGTPKGGEYQIVCVDEVAQEFDVIDPKGNIRAKNVAAGTLTVDGIDFTITSTLATVGESAQIEIPVTSCLLEISWAGSTGNSVTLPIEGPSNFGAVWALTPFTGGAGETSVSDALAQIGDVWNTMVITSEKTETQLDSFNIWGEGRWGVLVHKPAVVFYGDYSKTVGEATFVTQNRGSDRVTCQLVSPGSPSMPWVIAAAQVNRIVSLAQVNPAHDYGSQN